MIFVKIAIERTSIGVNQLPGFWIIWENTIFGLNIIFGIQEKCRDFLCWI